MSPYKLLQAFCSIGLLLSNSQSFSSTEPQFFFNHELAENTSQESALTWFLATQSISPSTEPLKVILTTHDFLHDGYLGFLKNLFETVKKSPQKPEIKLVIQAPLRIFHYESELSKISRDTFINRLDRFGLLDQPVYFSSDDFEHLFLLDVENATIHKHKIPEADLTLSIAHHFNPNPILKRFPNPLHIGWIDTESHFSGICTTDFFSSFCLPYLQGFGNNSLGILKDSTMDSDVYLTVQSKKSYQQKILDEIITEHPDFIKQLTHSDYSETLNTPSSSIIPFFYTYSHDKNSESLLEYITFIASITPDDWSYLPFIIHKNHFDYLNDKKNWIATILEKQGLSVSFDDDTTRKTSATGKHIALIKKPYLKKHHLNLLQDMSEPIWGISSHNSLIEAIGHKKIPFFLSNEWNPNNKTCLFNDEIQNSTRNKIDFSDFFQNSFSLYDYDFYVMDSRSNIPVFEAIDKFQTRKAALGHYDQIEEKANLLSKLIPSATPLVFSVLNAAEWLKAGNSFNCPLLTNASDELCRIKHIIEALKDTQRKVSTSEIIEQIKKVKDPIIRDMLERQF